ncbi:unnamed protein product, partial [Amoebophrya sp. A120]|eukprot:GSA120T00016762001.1
MDEAGELIGGLLVGGAALLGFQLHHVRDRWQHVAHHGGEVVEERSSKGSSSSSTSTSGSAEAGFASGSVEPETLALFVEQDGTTHGSSASSNEQSQGGGGALVEQIAEVVAPSTEIQHHHHAESLTSVLSTNSSTPPPIPAPPTTKNITTACQQRLVGDGNTDALSASSVSDGSCPEPDGRAATVSSETQSGRPAEHDSGALATASGSDGSPPAVNPTLSTAVNKLRDEGVMSFDIGATEAASASSLLAQMRIADSHKSFPLASNATGTAVTWSAMKKWMSSPSRPLSSVSHHQGDQQSNTAKSLPDFRAESSNLTNNSMPANAKQRKHGRQSWAISSTDTVLYKNETETTISRKGRVYHLHHEDKEETAFIPRRISIPSTKIHDADAKDKNPAELEVELESRNKSHLSINFNTSTGDGIATSTLTTSVMWCVLMSAAGFALLLLLWKMNKWCNEQQLRKRKEQQQREVLPEKHQGQAQEEIEGIIFVDPEDDQDSEYEDALEVGSAGSTATSRHEDEDALEAAASSSQQFTADYRTRSSAQTNFGAGSSSSSSSGDPGTSCTTTASGEGVSSALQAAASSSQQFTADYGT